MSKNNFNRNFAVIIGINNYQNSIRKLITAVPDALKLAEIIQKQHENLKPQYQAQNKYEVQLFLNQRASLSQLKQLIADFKQGQISLDREKVTVTESDRLLFYFAGHGIALDALENQEGPVGYLIPQDAISGDSSTYLPMQELHDALNALPCRHLLAILDCCFAGAFRWASLKREVVRKVKVYKERYDRFISDRAWQVITSASDDQKALDSLGSRGRVTDGNEVHSPFAQALFDVLLGKGGDLNQDGMVTATELYSYLRDRVEIASENYYQRQTPSLCPLRKHDKGEFIFLLPDFDRDKLEDAPPLNVEKNPYRGLSSYDEKDSNLFFGREEQIQKLYQKVVDNKQQLTLVLGASGTGKSSLVKAGLIPKLRKDDKTWRILPPFRPGESPLKSLNKVLESVKQPLIQAGTSSRLFTPAEESLANWFKNNPQAKLLVVIDQFEELITLSKSEEAEKFQIFIKNILAQYPNNIHVVITLRLDFEAQFQTSVLKDFWNDDARFVVSPMNQNEFRQAIEKPALEKVLYFDPPSLVDELINEVVQMPGALPLLSFTLSELYLKYLGDRTRDNRALTKKDYEELGRVVGSLTKRANQEYDQLVKENPAYQDTVRQIMLRMISLQGGELARRQVPKSELVYSEQEENKRVQTVIKRFSEARLIVEGSNAQGESYVEPAHDALVQGWNQLLAWKKENEENIILQRRLTPAVVEWKNVASQQKKPNVLVKTEPFLDWIDRKLDVVENLVNTINNKVSKNTQERSRDKSEDYLWDDNPYLNVLNEKLQSSDNWLTEVEGKFVQLSVRQRQRNTRLRFTAAISFVAVLSAFFWGLTAQREAQIGQTQASRLTSEVNLLSNREFEALFESLRAGNSLRSGLLWLFKPEDTLRNEVVSTLQKSVYRVRERNRLEIKKLVDRFKDKQLDRISFDATGKLMATFINDKEIELWDLENQKQPIYKFKAESDRISSGIYSPDTSKLAVITQDKKTIQLWNTQNNQKFFQLEPQGSIRDVLFSPDSKLLAISVENDTLMLWSLESNQWLFSIKLSENFFNMTWSDDGRYLITNAFAPPYNPRNWDLAGKEVNKKIELPLGIKTAQGLRLSPNVKQINNISVTGREGTTTSEVLDLNGQSLLPSFKKYHKLKGDGVVWSHDGKQIATVDDDGIVRLWDFQDKYLDEFQITENTDNYKRTFSSKFLAIPSKNNTIDVWNWNNKQKLRPLPLNSQNSHKLTKFSSNGKLLAVYGDSGIIDLWDLERQQQLLSLNTSQSGIVDISFSSDDKLLATAGNDGTVKVWNWESKKQLPEFENNFGNVQQIFLVGSYNRLLLATITGNQGDFQLWNLNEKQNLAKFTNISGVDFSRDGKIMAIAARDNLRLWNLEINQELDTLFPECGTITKLIFSSDSKLLAADGSNDKNKYKGFICLWNISGQKLAEFETSSFISDFGFSQDRNLLATALFDGTVKVWRIESLDDLIARGCKWIHPYIRDSRNISRNDSNLCN
ncbi:MAG: caspase family protein [Nostoc sp. ZfuVER08]|nr:caspase family protein [Nostoc sp. ZfuVER08]